MMSTLPISSEALSRSLVVTQGRPINIFTVVAEAVVRNFIQTPTAPPALAEELLGSCEAAEAAAHIGLAAPRGRDGCRRPPPIAVRSPTAEQEPPAEGTETTPQVCHLY